MLSVFVAERRPEEILDVLKRCYYIKKQKNVPIFYATSKDLREFTTTEKDMKRRSRGSPTELSNEWGGPVRRERGRPGHVHAVNELINEHLRRRHVR